jgi:hypothetical protein
MVPGGAERRDKMIYTRKDLDGVARGVIRDRRAELSKEYKHTPKLYGWSIIITGSDIALSVTYSDHTGIRQARVGI